MGPYCYSPHGPGPQHEVKGPGVMNHGSSPPSGKWLSFLYAMHGKLPPGGEFEQQECRARIVHLEGNATALAFWDTSKADPRPGANTVILMQGLWGFDQACAIAEEAYPTAFEDLKTELVNVTREAPAWGG